MRDDERPRFEAFSRSRNPVLLLLLKYCNTLTHSDSTLLERRLRPSLLIARDLLRNRVENLLDREVRLVASEPEKLLLDSLPAVEAVGER